MSEPKKAEIRPLDDGEDFGLWEIRVSAVCNAKGLSKALLVEKNPYEDPDEIAAFEEAQRKSSGIMVSALSNKALRIVRGTVNNPFLMLKKLRERYDSKTPASRIAKMTELMGLRYESIRKDLGAHVDRMDGIFEKLDDMQTSIPGELRIAILIASIDASELIPMTAALKTLSDDEANWEDVSARLIDEQKTLKSKMKENHERATAVKEECPLCQKVGHSIDKCWRNPKNPDNRLNLPNSGGSKLPRKHQKSEERLPSTRKLAGMDDEGPYERVATARIEGSEDITQERMMLDSGTTSHMTTILSTLSDASTCDIPISLGDDSTVNATARGTKRVSWKTSDGCTNVSLTNTLCAEDLALSLLSVPSLAQKGLSVLFLPEKAIIMDIHNNMRVVGVAPLSEDGLYYINTSGLPKGSASRNECTAGDKAMMAVSRRMAYEASNGSEIDSSFTNETRSVSSSDDVPELLNSDAEEGSEEENYSTNSDIEFLPRDSSSEMMSSVVKKPYSSVESHWHARLGHVGRMEDVAKMIKNGVLAPPRPQKDGCDPCMKGKFRRFYRGKLTKANNGGFVHADVVGRINPLFSMCCR